MRKEMDDASFTDDLYREHRLWLTGFDPQVGKNWEKLEQQNPEAAMCEAAVRRLLEINGNLVEPNESLDGTKQSPDFRCTQSGNSFLVEVTSITKEKATVLTGLNHIPTSNYYSGVGSLTDAIFHAAKSKTPQCSNQGLPTLVAIGTFHFQASNICFERMHLEQLLTGETSISQRIDITTGGPAGDAFLSTELRSATFLSPEKNGSMRHARSPISGILTCGFGCIPPKVRCALHPRPIHALNRFLIPKIECCQLCSGYDKGTFVVEWF